MSRPSSAVLRIAAGKLMVRQAPTLGLVAWRLTLEQGDVGANAGIAAEIVRELETWARELGYKELILETGKRQPWAIALYERVGFVSIPNYGHYADDDNSVCFKKSLS